MNIKRKLPLVISLLVAVPLFMLSIVIYSYISSYLIDKSTMQLSQIVKLQSKSLSSFLHSEESQIKGLSEKYEITQFVELSNKTNVDNRSYQEKSIIVSDMIKKDSNISSESQGYFIINRDGKILASGNKELMSLNVKDRDYFIKALNGEYVISDFLLSKIHNEFITIIAYPIRNNSGSIIGVIAKGLSSEYIKSFIFNEKIGRTGYLYLVDSISTIIYHPDIDTIGNSIINSEVKNISKRVSNGELIDDPIINYTFNNTKKTAAVHVIPEAKWIIVAVRDVKDINSSAIIIFIIIISTAISFSALSIFIGRKFSKSIIEPLYKLMDNMKKAASGDLFVLNNYDKLDEIGELSNSFNSMINTLRGNYDELSSIYEELAATEEELRTQYDELIESQGLLQTSEERYKLAIEGAKDIIWDLDMYTKKIYVSERWRQLSDYVINDRILNRDTLKQIVHPEDIKKLIREFYKHYKGKTPYFLCEFRLRLSDDSYIWVLNRGKLSKDINNNFVRAAGSITDITYRKKAEEDIAYMAYNDLLTCLPNRTFFIKEVNEWINNVEKNKLQAALFFIDIDNFKNINDTLGHDFGDKILKAVGDMLTNVIKKEDIICRFGGDEFIIFQKSINNYIDCEVLADKILSSFNSMFEIENKTVYVTASIGISIYSTDGDDSEGLLKNADTAMYKAKEKGKNAYEFYHKNMYIQLERKILIEKIIRKALMNDEFEVYYQPKVNIKTGTISGFEALIRLIIKEHGFISPGEFIPVAEDTGLIVPLGMVVLDKVCKQIESWKQIGYTYGSIAVNVSTVQFQQKDFSKNVKSTIDKYNIDFNDIELEITESVLIKSLEESIRVLNEFRNMGIQISLDDFGTGYSSLTYLKEIPASNIKIDKSFIDDICSNNEKSALIDGIIFIAHKMGLKVIAEGVEHKEQLLILIDKDCDEVQGYIYSKPMNKSDVEELLGKGEITYSIDKL